MCRAFSRHSELKVSPLAATTDDKCLCFRRSYDRRESSKRTCSLSCRLMGADEATAANLVLLPSLSIGTPFSLQPDGRR